jgi:hypothetical protein
LLEVGVVLIFKTSLIRQVVEEEFAKSAKIGYDGAV